MDYLELYKKDTAGKSAEQILGWALGTFGTHKLVLATSFSIEDQVLTHMIIRLNPKARIFTLDTGRLFEETYEVMQKTMQALKISIEVFAPDAADLETLISREGPNAFYESVGKRKTCCALRKLRPLKRALKTADAWICGLRSEQSAMRTSVEAVEWDAQSGLYKINPLFDWTEERVWQYIAMNNIPYNRLYDQGFKSIGCAPCTRTVRDGEDVRSGRWWWEAPEHKECGLHCRVPENEIKKE